METKPLNIGLIGLDTSHVIAFASYLNDPTNKDYVAGGKITVGFPGASQDFDASKNRVEGFTKDLREKFGVKIVDSPKAVADACDLIFISSVDGRRHLEFFKQVVGAKKPVYIDKPMTTTYSDAKEIVRLAESAGIPVMTSSSLRYDEEFDRILSETAANKENPITGIDVFGPVASLPPIPHWFWYGIHSVEIVMTAFGPGCRRVHSIGDKHYDLLSLQWSDGRGAMIHGMSESHSKFGATIHRKKDFVNLELGVKGKAMAARLVEAIMATLPHGKTAVPLRDSLEIVRILEAADQSRDTGKVVEI